ncbi:hypothetical protein PBAC_19260 [Pedobacter glucosidilyticus]|jgi:hypothetical protein|nr:hypothetical protein PBAC_19260 [Pedobacter glucosidilyticus]
MKIAIRYLGAGIDKSQPIPKNIINPEVPGK